MSDSLPPHRLVHGILQVRILEWAALPFSSGSSWPRNRTEVSCIAGRFFTNWAMREALIPHIFKSYDDEPWFVSIFIHCAKDLAYNPAMWRPTIWVLGVLLYSFFGNFFLCSGIPVGQIDVGPQKLNLWLSLFSRLFHLFVLLFCSEGWFPLLRPPALLLTFLVLFSLYSQEQFCVPASSSWMHYLLCERKL